MAALLVAALSTTLVVGVRYLAVSGAFALATRVKRPGLYAGLVPQIRREIGWSLLSAGIYGAPAGLVGWGFLERGWTRVYTDVGDHPLAWLPLSVLVYLLAHDTWFYWVHRLLHRPRWYRVAHAVHHASRPPTVWAAMSFHPLEAVSGAVVIPTLVFLVPIHVGMLGVVLGIMTLLAATNHLGWELFPRVLVEGRAGRWLITASHHQRHHDQVRCNYGLYFRFWDRLCGTDRGLVEPGRAQPRPRLPLEGPGARLHAR